MLAPSREELETLVATTQAEFKSASDDAFEIGTNPYSTPTEILVACKIENEKRLIWHEAHEALRLFNLADKEELAGK